LVDEAFGYLKRVIVTPAVYSRLNKSLCRHIQSTGQNSHCTISNWTRQAVLGFN